MGNSSAGRLHSSSQIECKSLVPFVLQQRDIVGNEICTDLYKDRWCVQDTETNLLFMLQLECQDPFEAPHSRKMQVNWIKS